MKTLHLTLKKKWFDMIASGEKTEEYREIKKHWIKQLLSLKFNRDAWKDEAGIISYILEHSEHFSKMRMKKYDTITFRNGYSKDAPTIVLECKGIEISEGNPDWGAEPGVKYFVIKLGKQI